eukprot:1957710-Prymnesium_polylepis.2
MQQGSGIMSQRLAHCIAGVFDNVHNQLAGIPIVHDTFSHLHSASRSFVRTALPGLSKEIVHGPNAELTIGAKQRDEDDELKLRELLAVEAARYLLGLNGSYILSTEFRESRKLSRPGLVLVR